MIELTTPRVVLLTDVGLWPGDGKREIGRGCHQRTNLSHVNRIDGSDFKTHAAEIDLSNEKKILVV